MKCPRCSNSNLKDDYKYFPICGFKIEFRTYEESKEFFLSINTINRGFNIDKLSQGEVIKLANILNYEFSQIEHEQIDIDSLVEELEDY